MEMAAPFEVMGQGSYGCVVKPALTNVVDGSPKNYPGNVSKIFYDEEAAKEALVKANFWYRTFGEKEHKMSDYVQKYSYATLPGEIKAKCAGLGSDRPIYVTRMPNLGVSINELARHPDLIAQIRRVPFERILQQIDKLFNQIKVIYEKGYVHGDIRSRPGKTAAEHTINSLTRELFCTVDKTVRLIRHPVYIGIAYEKKVVSPLSTADVFLCILTHWRHESPKVGTQVIEVPFQFDLAARQRICPSHSPRHPLKCPAYATHLAIRRQELLEDVWYELLQTFGQLFVMPGYCCSCSDEIITQRLLRPAAPLPDKQVIIEQINHYPAKQSIVWIDTPPALLKQL